MSCFYRFILVDFRLRQVKTDEFGLDKAMSDVYQDYLLILLIET